ncbi:hypothetical protein SteCoe_31105 [Stentor coeruleus]|uniref:Far11/STRP C-terminal domain-containing protein n=1 Tax=Stentor coeruleus TaxID=5963 RepID=A0A1R2B2I1_9CILI|nr:hypothetical protein SteCoe_31105 [Stentor coeruleus]
MEKFELFFSYSESPEMNPSIQGLESISDMLECFEGATQSLRRTGMCALYSKLFNSQLSSLPLSQSLTQTSKAIIDQGGLSLLIHHLAFLASQLCPQRDLLLEQELRMVLNILYTILLFSPREEVQNELSQNSLVIEEALLGLIKQSTDIVYVPIKKVSMVFEIYLKIILEKPEKSPNEGMDTKTNPPRCRLPAGGVEAFYRRMVSKDNPLSTTVVGLLRSLLACCPGATITGIDIRQEWQSPTLLLSQQMDFFSQSNMVFPDEARHRVVTGLFISKVLFLLIKRFRLNHYLQFQYLSQLINDANGILVLLKFLNLDFAEISKTSSLKDIHETNRDFVIEKCLETMLKVCYKINKGHPDRIQANLVQFKSSLIFKKLMGKFITPKIEMPCLKLMRIQVKYLTKKWKSYPSNMKIISEIYQKLKPSKEDWLSETGEGGVTADQVRQMNYDFNYYNYWQAMENTPPESPQIPQDFQEMYEQWLEENVWGYSYMC